MSSVLVGMFDSQSEAAEARSKLMAAGFTSAAVTMTGDTSPVGSTTEATEAETPHEGGISGWFRSLFGDDETSSAAYTHTYKEAFRRGGCGVSVTAADDAEMERAAQILNDCGAVDIDEKSEQWRKEGWTGAALTGGTAAAAGTLPAGQTQKLQEVEEELKVGKRAVARGGVRIFSRMTEVPVEETVRLREEHANIERKAVDRPATEADFSAFKEGSIDVHEMSEEAVVSKTARVTGEVSIGKEVTERDEVVRDTVRKTKVDVEQIGGGTLSGETTRSGVGATGYADTTGSPHRDPITGTPGAHPVGTAVGATAGGAAAAAAVGSVAGPVGTVVGAAVGAVAGGLAGKGAAEAVDPTDPNAKTASTRKTI